MGRFSTDIHQPPPVRISRASARTASTVLLRGSQRTVDGADAFAKRDGVYASVPLRLRIDKGATTPNSKIGVSGVFAAARARRKAGYPPISLGDAGG